MSITVQLRAVIPNFPDSIEHLSTDWQISKDKNFNNIIYQSLEDEVNKTILIKILNIILNTNETLWFRTRVNTSIGTNDWSEPTPCSSSIETPTLTIIGIDNDPTTIPSIQTSAFKTNNIIDTHKATEWIILEKDTSKLIWNEISTTNKITIPIPLELVNPNKSYILLAKHIGYNTESPYGLLEYKLELAILNIETPILNVDGYPGNVNRNPTFIGSDFKSDPVEINHISTDWTLKTLTNDIVFQSLNDTNNLTALTLPNKILDIDTKYILEVIYKSSSVTSEKGILNFKTKNILIEDPVISILGEPNNVDKNNVVITSSNFTLLEGSDIHVSTNWILVNENDDILWESLNNNINLTSITLPNNVLDFNTLYAIKVKYNGNETSTDTVIKFFKTKDSVEIDKPTISITGEPNDINLTPTFNLSPFTLISGIDTHQSTDWIILDINNNIIYQSLQDSINLTSLTLPNNILDYNSSYTIKVRYNGTQVSSLNTFKNFNTKNISIDTPVLTVNGLPNNIPLSNIIITGSTFNVNNISDVHVSTDWIIEDSNGNVIWNSLNNTTDLTSITISGNVLSSNSTYTFKARYNGNIISSLYGSVTGTTVNATIDTPTLKYSLDPSFVDDGNIIEISDYIPNNHNEPAQSIEWEVRESISNNLIFSETTSSSLKLNRIPKDTLITEDSYKLRARYNSQNLSSDFGEKTISLRENESILPKFFTANITNNTFSRSNTLFETNIIAADGISRKLFRFDPNDGDNTTGRILRDRRLSLYDPSTNTETPLSVFQVISNRSDVNDYELYHFPVYNRFNTDEYYFFSNAFFTNINSPYKSNCSHVIYNSSLNTFTEIDNSTYDTSSISNNPFNNSGSYYPYENRINGFFKDQDTILLQYPTLSTVSSVGGYGKLLKVDLVNKIMTIVDIATELNLPIHNNLVEEPIFINTPDYLFTLLVVNNGSNREIKMHKMDWNNFGTHTLITDNNLIIDNDEGLTPITYKSTFNKKYFFIGIEKIYNNTIFSYTNKLYDIENNTFLDLNKNFKTNILSINDYNFIVGNFYIREQYNYKFLKITKNNSLKLFNRGNIITKPKTPTNLRIDKYSTTLIKVNNFLVGFRMRYGVISNNTNNVVYLDFVKYDLDGNLIYENLNIPGNTVYASTQYNNIYNIIRPIYLHYENDKLYLVTFKPSVTNSNVTNTNSKVLGLMVYDLNNNTYVYSSSTPVSHETTRNFYDDKISKFTFELTSDKGYGILYYNSYITPNHNESALYKTNLFYNSSQPYSDYLYLKNANNDNVGTFITAKRIPNTDNLLVVLSNKTLILDPNNITDLNTSIYDVINGTFSYTKDVQFIKTINSFFIDNNNLVLEYGKLLFKFNLQTNTWIKLSNSNNLQITSDGIISKFDDKYLLSTDYYVYNYAKDDRLRFNCFDLIRYKL